MRAETRVGVENGVLAAGLGIESEVADADVVAERLLEEVLYHFGVYGVTFYKKQLDYGQGNISKFGKEGVLVRLYDKVERLRNLYAKGRNASNESVRDTLYDIIGYGVISLLLLDGVWPTEDCNEPPHPPA